jgi:ABC-2 type transport system permease protein
VSAVTVLAVRQLKRYFRARTRLIGSLGQPILFLLAMGFGFGPTYQKAGGGDYIQFLAPGIILMGILFTAVLSGIEIIWDRQFGFLKETLVAPVSRLKIVMGRTLGGALVAFFQGAIVFAICLVAGFRIGSWALFPLVPVFMFVSAVLFTSVGTAIGSVLEDMQAFPLIMNFLVMPLFFFSSALFPMQGLPKVMSLLVRLNPLTYCVDGLRGAFGHLPPDRLGFDFLILVGLTAILVALGSHLFSKIEV